MDVFKLFGTIAIDASEAVDEVDKVTKTIGNANKKIVHAIGKIEKSFVSVGHALNRVGETAEKAGRNIARGISIGAAAVSTAAATIGKNALDIRSSIEQGMGGADAVFQQYSTHIKDSAKDAWKTAGLSVEEYLSTANKMGSLFKGAGFGEMEAVEYTANAMQRAADVASIMGIDINMAMESIAGMAKGNFTMMDNLGVAMNDTTLEAYRLEKGMAKSVSTMTTAEKVGLAYEMFMERTADYAGNYAKENETAAGSLQTLKAAWSNFLGGVGTFDDLEKSAFGYLRIAAKTMGLEGFEPMIDGAQKTVEDVAEILAMEGLDGRQKYAKIRRYLLEKSVGLTSAMGDKIIKGVSSASDIISETLSDINVNLPHYLSVGWKIFNSVRDGVKAASSQLANTAEVVSSDAISAWFTTKTDFIAIGLDILGGIAKGITDDLAKGADSKIAASVQEGVGNVLNKVFEHAPTGINALGGVMVLVTNTLGAIAEGITQELNSENGDELTSSLTTAIVKILNAASSNLPLMLDAGLTIVTKIGDAVSEKKDSISGGIANLVGAITTWLTNPDNLAALGKAALNIGAVILDGTLKGLAYSAFAFIDTLFGTEFEARARAVQMKDLNYVATGKINGVAIDPSDTEKLNNYLNGMMEMEDIVNSMEVDPFDTTVNKDAIDTFFMALIDSANEAEEAVESDTESIEELENKMKEAQAALTNAENEYIEKHKVKHLLLERMEDSDYSSGFDANKTALLRRNISEFEKYFHIRPDGSSEPNQEYNLSQLQKAFSTVFMEEANKEYNAAYEAYVNAEKSLQEAAEAFGAASEPVETLGDEASDAADSVSDLKEAAESAAESLNAVQPPAKQKPGATPVAFNAKGAVFSAPTIFDTRLGRQMVGEAGPEAVAPIAVLQKYVQAAVQSANLERDGIMAELASAIQELREGFNANMNLYINKKKVASAMSREMGRSIGNREYTLLKGMGG